MIKIEQEQQYISYLMTVDELSFYDEIDCSDLFDENKELTYQENSLHLQSVWWGKSAKIGKISYIPISISYTDERRNDLKRLGSEAKGRC